MVLIRIRIYQVLRILEIFGTFTSTWPPDSTAGKREIFLRDLGWTLAILNVSASLPPLILGAWYSENDVIRMMKALSESTALMEVLLNLILCRIQRSRLQKLLAQMRKFLKHSELNEKHIIQKYINRYSGFYAFVGISYILAAITFSCGPLFLSINLPMEAWYPFSIETPYTRGILYILQVFAILQTGFCITVDFMIAMFFWYSSAKLEMLELELQQITHESDVKTCIQKHQEIISFVDEVQYTVRYLICKSNITMASAVICGAFPLIHKQPLAVTAQFICMVLGGCERLYITAWPADDLAEISQRIAWSAYCIPWFEKSHETITNISIFMQRSQKPLLISMGGLFPVLSVQYYANFLKTISSYFMTMRACVIQNILYKNLYHNMALINLKFEQLLYLLRVFGTITNTWPPHPNIRKSELLLRKFYYYFIIFIFVTVWIGMFLNTYKNRNDDVGELMKTISQLTASMEAVLNSILCTIKRKQLQSLVISIEEFMKFAQDREIVILQKYIDRYAPFITIVVISFGLASLTVICAPLFMPQEFPLNVWYPFSTESLLRKFILYITHIITTAYTGCCLDVDIMIALFCFYTAARLEMLTLEIGQATDEIHVISAIKKHQEIIQFISRTQRTLQYILFKTNFTMAFTVISGGFPILYLQNSILIPQFLSMALGALQRFFISAWAADDLREVSTRLPWSVYSASWIDKTREMKSDILIMLQKCQEPILISMGSFLPALTLQYYGDFVTKVMSYFMTMRVVIAA
ncbi:uncharacterized protein [Anoplolepis gracilipes]|uniref:uncharacterized protein n=1 Tax=Anoplolepis gracilipes TaxID=354296 RepID=UPI003BA3B340